MILERIGTSSKALVHGFWRRGGWACEWISNILEFPVHMQSCISQSDLTCYCRWERVKCESLNNLSDLPKSLHQLCIAAANARDFNLAASLIATSTKKYLLLTFLFTSETTAYQYFLANPAPFTRTCTCASQGEAGPDHVLKTALHDCTVGSGRSRRSPARPSLYQMIIAFENLHMPIFWRRIR